MRCPILHGTTSRSICWVRIRAISCLPWTHGTGESGRWCEIYCENSGPTFISFLDYGEINLGLVACLPRRVWHVFMGDRWGHVRSKFASWVLTLFTANVGFHKQANLNPGRLGRAVAEMFELGLVCAVGAPLGRHVTRGAQASCMPAGNTSLSVVAMHL